MRSRQNRYSSESNVQPDEAYSAQFAEGAAQFARMGADGKKARVAGSVRAFAAALRSGTLELPQEHNEFRPLLNGVADRADRVSSYLADRDVDSLVNDVRQLARRHPSLVIGSVFAVGFIGMRMLLDSAHRTSQETRPNVDGLNSTIARLIAEEYDEYATAAQGSGHG